MVSTIKYFFIFLFFSPSLLFAQESFVVDKIVAIVGGTAILESDIQNQMLQQKAQHQDMSKCQVFENFLVQKLLVNQAKVDSVEVKDEQVDMQLESRIKYFIDQAGSKEKLEAYFNKSIFQIKEDMRTSLKEQMIVQKMQGQINEDTKITPTEVKDFYDSIPKDSIPIVNTLIEYQQIVKYPSYADKSIYELKKKLLELRKRIMDGESFATLAYLYSEDPGSAQNGGDIGFMSKGELDPEYGRVAFNLKENAVSGIVESQFGYHIIQLIARKDDKVDTRHILLRPKPTDEEIKQALTSLDSIKTLLVKDTLSFEKAALYFSEDKNSRLSGGNVVNPVNNSTKFELEQLPQEDYYMIKKMKVGEISDPFMSKDDAKKTAYKIIKLVSRTDAHKANLTDDYQLLQDLALESKKKKVVQQWVEDKLAKTYVRIDDSYKNCNFRTKGWIK